ncbi:MAG: outer membrane lipoprotein chaperone LolA [Candidatus Stahlbacteria bacterium]|nr:MAG: outer membrane lipoprotein chaperone LolA [Candidatus Stahlbacteria bacterium]
MEVRLHRLILAALVGVGFLVAASPRKTFNAVITRYAGISSLTASFEERICSKKDGTCQILKGTFTYASPNKFRVDVTVPMEQLVLSDGVVTWIYLPTANQAIKTKPGPEQEMFLFVERLQNYSEQYTVQLKPAKEFLEAHFTVKPGKKVFVKSFVMLIDASRNELAGIKVEQGDNEVIFLLEDFQYNAEVAESQFTFSPPEGTTVIEDTGTGYQ